MTHLFDNRYLLFRTLGPTEEELTTLQCTICSNKFDNLPTLMKHKVLHLQKCEVCNVTYPSFRDHLQSRKHKIAIRTRRYEIQFSSWSWLNFHQLNCLIKWNLILSGRVSDDGVISFSCDKCDDIEFPNLAKILEHIKKTHQRISQKL